MNKLNLTQSLIHHTKPKLDKGFTLIELMIVVFILGILSAMLLPNTLKQAAKAREVEGKNNLGMLARAQQVYHFENTTFATSVATVLNNALIQTKYYDFPDPVVATGSIVKHQAVSNDPAVNQVRNYATGVYFNSGAFAVAVCESTNFDTSVNVGDTVADPCTDGGTRLR